MRISFHAMKRFRQRFGLLFRKDQIARLDWFIPYLIKNHCEKVMGFEAYPFYCNKKGLTGATVYKMKVPQIYFVIKDDVVVTCFKNFNIRK